MSATPLLQEESKGEVDPDPEKSNEYGGTLAKPQVDLTWGNLWDDEGLED